MALCGSGRDVRASLESLLKPCTPIIFTRACALLNYNLAFHDLHPTPQKVPVVGRSISKRQEQDTVFTQSITTLTRLPKGALPLRVATIVSPVDSARGRRGPCAEARAHAAFLRRGAHVATLGARKRHCGVGEAPAQQRAHRAPRQTGRQPRWLRAARSCAGTAAARPRRAR